MTRTEIREQAFKLLYSIEIQKEYEEKQIDLYIDENEIEDENAKNYIETVIKGVMKNKNEIQEEISKNLKEDWAIDRISKVDLAILKLAIYEIKHENTPYKVVINEAVELAKKYGDDKAKSFVNGILASVVQEKEE